VEGASWRSSPPSWSSPSSRRRSRTSDSRPWHRRWRAASAA